jgi:hypothetical protein
VFGKKVEHDVCYNGFKDSQIKLVQDIARRFNEIDFETYNNSDDLAKYISLASQKGNILAYDAINTSLENICFGMKSHLINHGVDTIKVALYGGLFSSNQNTNKLKSIIIRELLYYNIEISKFEGNILCQSWKLVENL